MVSYLSAYRSLFTGSPVQPPPTPNLLLPPVPSNGAQSPRSPRSPRSARSALSVLSADIQREVDEVVAPLLALQQKLMDTGRSRTQAIDSIVHAVRNVLERTEPQEL